MNELFISSVGTTISLASVQEAETVVFCGMLGSEIQQAIEAIKFDGCVLADVLLIMLDKAGMMYRTEPDQSLVITTEFGENIILSSDFIFKDCDVSNTDQHPDDEDIFSHFSYM